MSMMLLPKEMMALIQDLSTSQQARRYIAMSEISETEFLFMVKCYYKMLNSEERVNN